MKASYNWLNEYCAFTVDVERLARRLTMAGTEVEEVRRAGEDFCLEIEVTSNRPDLLGHVGIAREISALTSTPLALPVVAPSEGPSQVTDVTSVQVEAPDLCPRYTARVIAGIKVGASPGWLVERLECVGLRSVNNIVDITNYVMMEIGQPLHAFDFDKLRDKKIIVRRAVDGEQMTAIDESRHELRQDMLVIADGSRPVAIAGVMGGKDTEVDEQTVNILLESALFDPSSVRATSRLLKLSSDSSYRFERGVDPAMTEWASKRAAALIQELAGGKIARGVIDAKAEGFQMEAKPVELRLQRFKLLTGMEVTEDEAARILSGLGFEILERASGVLKVKVPSHRLSDVYREVDLIEEVARIHGYDHIPVETSLSVCTSQPSKDEIVSDEARSLMTAMGFTEIITYSITDDHMDSLASPWTAEQPLRVQNPMSRDFYLMRRSLLPGLLRTLKTNESHGVQHCRAFELSSVYLPTPGEKLPEEKICLAFLRDGDIYDVKGVLELLGERLNLQQRLTFHRHTMSFFEEMESAQVRVDGKPFGYMGKISQKALEAMDINGAPYAAEIDFDLLVSLVHLERKHARLSPFPPVVRDVAILVEEAVTWGEIEATTRELNQPLLVDVRFFDVYHGKQVPAGKKSVAFTLTYRSPERTLKSKEVDEAVRAVVTALERKFQAALRA